MACHRGTGCYRHDSTPGFDFCWIVEASNPAITWEALQGAGRFKVTDQKLATGLVKIVMASKHGELD